MFHSTSGNSLIDNLTGALYIRADDLHLASYASTETYLRGISNGAVELYYNNSKKLETDTNGIFVNGALRGDSVDLSDNKKILLGASDDLEIYHDGSDSVIKDAGTGRLSIQTSHFQVANAANSHTIINGYQSGAVELYHNNTLRLETRANDVKFHGGLVGIDNAQIQVGNSADLKIYHDGTDSYVDNLVTGNLRIRGNSAGAVELHPKGGQYGLRTVPDGATELYHSGNQKFQTTSGGCSVTGTLSTSGTGNVNISNGAGAITVNSGGDIRLNNASWTGDYAGKIQHANNFLYFQGGTGAYAFIFRDPGGANRLYIDENGHVIPADNDSYDLGTSSKRWRNIYTNDLNLSNEGSSNDVDGSWGDWTIQEGESDLFLKNNRSGKKYKFNLTEVS